jgi:hypothetical protein
MTMMLRRALPVIACLGGGLVLFSMTPALAQEEDEQPEMSIEQSIIHSLMSGIGAVNGRTSKGITYRERSPLVVPPSNSLPQPQASTARAPNWPKDPDELERQALIAAEKNGAKNPEEAMRPLTPAELAKGKTGRRREARSAAEQPGYNPIRQLMPNELGYKGGLFGNILTPQKEETASFTGEPPREQLTAPPTGYQTPSPAYSYGIGLTTKKQVDPTRALPPGQY